MDGCSGKRTIERQPFSRKGSGVLLRDRLNRGNQTVPICSRIKTSAGKGTPTSPPAEEEKTSPQPSSSRYSSTGKKILETSQRTCVLNRRKNDKALAAFSQMLTDSSDSRSDQDDPGISVLDLRLGSRHLSYMGCRKPEKAESSRFASSTRYFQQIHGSSSDSRLCRGKPTIKKSNFNGECSSSSSDKGKKVIEPVAEESNYSSSNATQACSCLNRPIRVSSVRTQRPVSSYSRTRLTNQESEQDSPISLELSSGSSEAAGISRSSLKIDSFRHYKPDRTATRLSALDRIEQDAELTYQQLLILETGFLLGSLNRFDQHRDMRLDIDNMSYEELLALEERMGTVSTALNEEALSKCLKTSFYATMLSGRDDEYDIKCCICQEEYREGDEVGKLECEHLYHVECIRQWLCLKNWCPICKTSAK